MMKAARIHDYGGPETELSVVIISQRIYNKENHERK
jgi:hypothetical protein